MAFGEADIQFIILTSNNRVTAGAIALYPIYGLMFSTIIAAVVMALSSVSMIGNSLRLRRIAI